MKKILIAATLGLTPLWAAAAGHHVHAPVGIGQPGDPVRVSRTVEVLMHDTMQYTPKEIEVEAGQTVRFLIKNVGNLPHEMVIGSLADLKAHAAEMQSMPEMAHAEHNAVALDAGKVGGLVWQFDAPGTVHFACLIPGHSEAGMVGQVKVN